MKRNLIIASALGLALALTGCDIYARGTVSEPGGASGAPDTSASSRSDASQPEEDSHQFAQEDNVLPHDEGGYCGNTITTVSANPLTSGEDWESSFWGDDSVVLTDLLLYLDYSGPVCRCLPEYYVKTEFSEESYGLNLTSGYVRHGGGQVELTEEQAEQIRDILNRNPPD